MSRTNEFSGDPNTLTPRAGARSEPVERPGLLFTPADSEAAYRAWGFNCGPAAIAAALGLTPSSVRPFLGEDWRGFMSPTEVENAVARAGWLPLRAHRCPERPAPGQMVTYPSGSGIVRVQFDGPWCDRGVPIGARYQRTHYAASHEDEAGRMWVFDVNAEDWMDLGRWREKLIPSLFPPKTTGWWVSHAWKLVRRG